MRKFMFQLVRSTVLVIAIASFTAASLVAQSDTTPPKLLDLTFSPSTVDVTAAAQTITFSLHITDDLSGIDTTSGNRIAVTLISPSANQFVTGFASALAGIVLDATVQVPVSIPRFSEAGTWTVRSVRLRDKTGNQVSVGTSVLAAAGFPTTLTVIDANPDVEPPQCTAVTMSPSSVNVSSAAASITVDLALTDNVSGISQIFNRISETGLTSDFRLTSPSGNQRRFLTIRSFQLISGTITNGTWRATLDMPQYSEPGVWKLTSLTLQDEAGNAKFHSAAELAAFGSSIELTVASFPSDTTKPVLTGLTFTPSFINTSVGAQTVQVDISATDDLSGISFIADSRVNSFFFGASLRSPSGAQSVFTNSLFSPATPQPPPISGTPQSGTWRFNATFPQFSEEGTWKVQIDLKDVTRNLSRYLTADISALGLPSQLEVVRPSLQPDGTIDPSVGGTIVDSTFGSRAELIIPAGVLFNSTTVAIDVFQSPLNLPIPTGFSTAETYFVNVQFTPQPTFPLPAPGITVVLPLRTYMIPGTAIDLYRVDPLTGNLEPSLDTSGNPVIGIVDAGGLTATFEHVAKFSTVVGLQRDAVTVTVDVKPGETPNVINTKSKGTVPVAIFSTPTFDVTKVDPATLRFSGASVAKNTQGRWQVSTGDLDLDGREDLIVHFETQELLLNTTDAEGVVEGHTPDGRYFRGKDAVKIL
jgi:hypothetical protein